MICGTVVKLVSCPPLPLRCSAPDSWGCGPGPVWRTGAGPGSGVLQPAPGMSQTCVRWWVLGWLAARLLLGPSSESVTTSQHSHKRCQENKDQFVKRYSDEGSVCPTLLIWMTRSLMSVWSPATLSLLARRGETDVSKARCSCRPADIRVKQVSYQDRKEANWLDYLFFWLQSNMQKV